MYDFETANNLAQQFMLLFQGSATAHGYFSPTHFEGVKQAGIATTVREPTVKEQWVSHLTGKKGLGIIPINEQSECLWAAIDIDDYNLGQIGWEELLKSIEKTPLVCCKSKSGGAHLYIFCVQSVSAIVMRDYLRNTVGSLGFGSSEIFPKQDRVNAEHGDVGNWLNMPYFGGNSRVCVVLDNMNKIQELGAASFCSFAYKKRVAKAFFDNIDTIDYDQSPIEGGPPCLQIMSINGFPPHTRNISLFNIGVYLKKATPDQWKMLIRQFNLKLFSDNRLSEQEVDEITKSLSKKEYAYQCYEEPLCSFCNAKLCRTRKYGISNVVGLPIINSVTKVTGDLSMWFIDVEGGRLELTTEELYDNRKFILRCLNDLNIMPNKMKPEKWSAFIQTIIDQMVEIRDEGMFQRHEIPQNFQQFMLARLSRNVGDLEANRTYYDEKENEIRFRFEAFLNYLKYKRINIAKSTIFMYFKSRGARSSVAKDRLRRSIRFMAVKLTDEEILGIKEKREEEEVI